jgi:hypothetical protein
MEKSLVITIYVDGVPLGELEGLQQAIEDALADYNDKRITTQIQDERLVNPNR